MTSLEARYEAAVQEIWNNGVAVWTYVEGKAHQEFEKIGLRYVLFAPDQKVKLLWKSDKAVKESAGKDGNKIQTLQTSLKFNAFNGAGSTVVEAFRKQGFITDWNNTDDGVITIAMI